MGAPLLTVDATLLCPHGGQAAIDPAREAVTARSTVCTEDDDVTIDGCAFTIGSDPSPCVTVAWQTTSVTCSAGDAALLTTGSEGLCLSAEGAPQGPVSIMAAQVAAVAT
jgi:hypothetical protein